MGNPPPHIVGLIGLICPIRKSRIGIMLTTFLTLTLITPALSQAPPPSGSWKRTKFHRNGTISVSSIGSSGSGPWYQYIFAGGQEREVGQGMGHSHAISLPGPVNDTVTSSGSADVEYTYVNASGLQITPPASAAKLYILESRSASWYGFGDFFSGSASDGFAPQLIGMLGCSGTSSGAYLRQFDGSSGKVSFTSGQLFATANAGLNSSPYRPSGSISAGVFYETTIDQRSVLLYSDAMENSGNYYKDANGQRLANKRASDGSMKVDAAATWDVVTYRNDAGMIWEVRGWRLNADIVALQSGFPPNYIDPVRVDWSIQGDGYLVNPPFYKWNNSVASDFPTRTPFQPTTVKVKVTDNRDGATAENFYTIQWHYRFEDWQKKGPAVPKETFRAVTVSGSTPYIGAGETALCLWSEYSWLDAQVWQSSVDWLANLLGILSNLPESAPKGACLAALGVLAGDLLPKPRSATTYFDAGWRRTGSTIEGGVWDDQNRGRFVMYPKRRLIYDAQKWKGSEYNVNGYSGPVETDLAPLSSSEFVGDYKWIITPPPMPH